MGHAGTRRRLAVGRGQKPEDCRTSWGPDPGGSSESVKVVGCWVRAEGAADGTSCLIVGVDEKVSPQVWG